MQIIKASKDITAISASASACQRNKRFNDFWPGWFTQENFPCSPLRLERQSSYCYTDKKKKYCSEIAYLSTLVKPIQQQYIKLGLSYQS